MTTNLSAATEGSNTRVENTQGLRASRWVETSVYGTGLGPVGELGVLLGLDRVGVVVDEEIPLHGLVLGGQGVQSWDLNGWVLASVLSGVDEQDAEAGHGQAGGHRGTSGPGADDYIVVSRVGHRACGV